MSYSDLLAVAAISVTALFTAISGFFMWKNGTTKISSDVITTYKARVEQLEQRVSTCENLHRENLGEIGKLKGMNEEKDKRVATLETILQGRNPEMNEFIKFVTYTSKQNHEILLGVKEFFDQLKNGKFMLTKVS